MFSYLPERLEERYLLAGTPTLVADLNTNGLSSWPSGFTVFQNALYYSAFDDQHGRELWKYDGTSATRVTDIDPGPGTNPGIGPEELTVFKGALYFRAYQPTTGMELWKYDGTSATLAADINPGDSLYAPFQNSRPQGLKVIGDRLYFSANDGVSGREIWSFDGTTATRLADLNPGQGDSEPFTATYDFTEFAGPIYFVANPGDNRNHLFRYDGQNVVRVDQVAGAPQLNSFWEGDLTVFHGALYFSGAPADNNLDRELWKFDGTSFSRVADIREGPEGSRPKSLFTFEDALYFLAYRPETGGELYKYDGVSVTLAGEFVQGTQDLGIFELNPVFLDGFVYFTAREGLYRYDGANILGIAGVPVRQDMAVFGDGLYLAGEFQANGSELARFDGNDIVLVADMRAGTESSRPGNFSSFNDTLYFTADSNQSSHAEIWKSDGSGAQIADPSREYFLPSALVTINGEAYFAAANDGDDGYELWRYDGDHSTKVLGRDVNGFDIYPPQLGTFGNELLFWGYGTQGGGDGPTVIGLWAFDGTTARPIAPGLVGNGDYPDSSSFTSFNGALYFRASEVYGGTMELWKYDGNSVVRAPGIAAGSLQVARGMKVYDGQLYFGASDPSAGGDELWKYDGAEATLAAEIRPGPEGSYPHGFEIHEGSLYFGASGDQFGDQLWRYNSTTGVAERVTNNLAFGPSNLATLAGVLYFSASPSDSDPVGLWSYDGVEAKSIAKLVNGSPFFRFKGALYFGADDGVHGYELWKLEPDVLAGDLNRDGTVSIADFINLAANFGKANAGWSQGDVNYDGEVTISDFMHLAANFGRSFAQPAASPALGELVGVSGNSISDVVMDERDNGAGVKREAGRAVHTKVASHRRRHHRREQQRMSWRWRGSME